MKNWTKPTLTKTNSTALPIESVFICNSGKWENPPWDTAPPQQRGFIMFFKRLFSSKCTVQC